MTTVTITNLGNGKSGSKDFPTQADAAAFILYMTTEFAGNSMKIEVAK